MKIASLALSLSLLASISAHADTIDIHAYVDNKKCEFMKDCELTGAQTIRIINDTNQDHVYDYTYSICNDKTTFPCLTEKNSILVPRLSTWSNSHQSRYVCRFDRYARHVVKSRVSIRGTQIADSEAVGEVILK